MQPVAPSTMVRGPAALIISRMTRADSQPWQVRCPDVKYSSTDTLFPPLKPCKTCVALVNVSGIVAPPWGQTPSIDQHRPAARGLPYRGFASSPPPALGPSA